MVTPAFAEIVDKNTIKLSQQGKILLVKFSADIPFKLVIRPSVQKIPVSINWSLKMLNTANIIS